MLLGVNERYVAVLGLVGIACSHGHAVERVQGEAAGVALHHAARNAPAGSGEGKGDTSERFLHRFAAAIAAFKVLPVDRFSFRAFSCENVLVSLEHFFRYGRVEQLEVHRNSHSLNVPAVA